MNNDHAKLLSLGIITGCGLIAAASAHNSDTAVFCGLMFFAGAVWFIVHFRRMKD